MLSAEDNELLTRVGPGTPMGDLLRRYWYPVAARAQLEAQQTMRVRILGENLALYKDLTGRFGLIAEACPHRGASMAWGIPEADGLRCMYHGWCFDSTGQCVDQPNEPAHSQFHTRIKTPAYPVEEFGGLLFAYLGPLPAPSLPKWDVLSWSQADGHHLVKQIGAAVLPCNWLQIMENSVDPIHAEWLHGKYAAYVASRLGRDGEEEALRALIGGKHVEIGFDRFEYGIIKRRIREGQTKDDAVWRVGHPLVFPNMLKVGGNGRYELQYRVPIDDTHTLHIWYQAIRPPADVEIPPQPVVPYYEMPIVDDNGAFLVDSINGQDIMAWVTQGAISDRTTEHIGSTDRGIVLLRRMLKEQLVKVADGDDPIGVHREDRGTIELPLEEIYRDDYPREVIVRALRGWRSGSTPEVQQVLDAIV